MKNFLLTIAAMFLLATLNSCTADEIESETPTKTQNQADIDPNNPGSIIPPKKVNRFTFLALY
ncbi:hypothetical protein [Flavobacterium hungaricum]|uniref:Uncharacterized protein n=1 Tax=Flavobacterium hungaricum TaxID=2082725 RepID=A0ABR9TNR0_9FLAO|nr:hypothetical protein [Flavobacterium hungaricum]MBE8726444.1 hypothetical protein [Flavobacterium hungaricum]